MKIECVTEKTDSTPIGIFMRQTYGLLAELERAKFRERAVRGKLETRVLKGRLLGQGHAAYGYNWNETRDAYLINEEEAEVVRRVFSMIANGHTIRSVALFLNKEKIPTRNGGIWRTGSLHGFLSNISYIGKATAYRHKVVKRPGRTTLNVHVGEDEQIFLPDGVIPPIVDEATFYAVQKKLKQNKIDAARHNPNPEDSLLRSGFVVCGYCGSNMNVARNPNQNKIDYSCNKGLAGLGECRPVSISVKILDLEVWEAINARVKLLARNITIVDEAIKRHLNEDPQEVLLPPISNRLTKVNTRIKNLIAMSQQDLDEDTLEMVNSQLVEASKNKQGLLDMQAQVATKRVEWEEIHKVLVCFRQWVFDTAGNVENASYEQKRTALRVLGVKVRVWKDGHNPRYTVKIPPPEIVSVVSSFAGR